MAGGSSSDASSIHPNAPLTSSYQWSIGTILRKILKTVWVILNLLILIAIPVVAYQMHKHDYEQLYIAWFIAGVFAMLSIPITFYEVILHLENYRAPKLQRHVIRILAMVPVYAIDCWFALRYKKATIYLDTVRECYEAYVVWNFYTYCMVYLQEFCVPGLEHALARKPRQHHLWPISVILGPPRVGEPFVRFCRHGIIQFVTLRPFCASIAFLTEAKGVYGDGQIMNPYVSYPYLAFVNNLSAAWAMYCLVLLYRATREELAPISPFYKFASVKAIIFFSFWQSVLIAFLVNRGIIRVNWIDPTWSDYDKADCANAIQEFLICVEMFFFALLHLYAFPADEYKADGGIGPVGGYNIGLNSTMSRRKLTDNLFDLFDVRDVLYDIKTFVENNTEWIQRKFNRCLGRGGHGSVPNSPVAGAGGGGGGGILGNSPRSGTDSKKKGKMNYVKFSNDDDDDDDDDEGDLPEGIKLGLGDFIFYSVLVGRAAMQSLFCAVFCYVAVISGLIVTLAGLALHKAALPALPVSIALGVITFVAIKFLIEPFLVYEFGRDAMESIPDDYNPGMSSSTSSMSSMSSMSSSSSYSLLGQSSSYWPLH